MPANEYPHETLNVPCDRGLCARPAWALLYWPATEPLRRPIIECQVHHAETRILAAELGVSTVRFYVQDRPDLARIHQMPPRITELERQQIQADRLAGMRR